MNTKFDTAARAGLVLGGISAAYTLLTFLIGKYMGQQTASTILTGILWIVKFSACIALMKAFMLSYAGEEPDAGISDIKKCGMLCALLSAFVYSIYYYLHVTYIAPDTFKDSIDAALKLYGSAMSRSDIDRILEMEGELPRISFFVNLIYCTLFGFVVASVLSRRMVLSNPFGNQNQEEQ